jgi:hypothetical protein
VNGWFERGHNHFGEGKVHFDGHWWATLCSGKFVWAPPPLVAWIALEELWKARFKHHNSIHMSDVCLSSCNDS